MSYFLKGAIVIHILLFFSLSAIARHIAGGEISYKYLGPGTAANSGKYQITLKLYRDCYSTGPMLDSVVTISIYAYGSQIPFSDQTVPKSKSEKVSLLSPDPCIGNPPSICYEIGYYVFTIDLPITSNGYTVAYQRCCRIEDIFNIINSSRYGTTLLTNIPGNNIDPTAIRNNSPEFNTSDTVIICANSLFNYDFSAKDMDGDLLEYSFDFTYNGATANDNPGKAEPPPYTPLNYTFGFSSAFPLGPDAVINSKTGLISGRAPSSGIYVIVVSVVEKRNGKIINTHRKELNLKVADCQLSAAELEPTYITCNDLTLNFSNKTNSPLIRSYEWDFGVLNTTADISTSPTPSFTFPSPGTYDVRLITNKNEKCSDTAFAIAKIYPGFFPKISIDDACTGVPFVFRDETKTAFGKINKWKWDFGNTSATDDTSNLPVDQYTYTQGGAKNISLIVGTDLGCSDTVKQVLNVNAKPTLTITNDTVICTIDTLRLNAIGTGTFSWSPDYMISNTSVANPLVSPDIPTRYTVTVTQAPGCENTKSVFVDVKSFVSLKAGYDTTICLGDSILLSPVSDAVSYAWSPASIVSNPSVKQAWAKPIGDTRISVFTKIGKCQANDGFLVKTEPYPKPYAGKDTSVCFGDSAKLIASGGNKYLWSPGNTLDDETLQSPYARPYQTTNYIVGVYDIKGCPKPSYDTVRVSVIPPVNAFAGNDTVVVIGQPLQLFATGGTNFVWTPTSFLNDAKIATPIAKLNDDIKYIVKVSTPEGCFGFDSLMVKVYKTPPEIFVPTAFTPNDDNLNDLLVPVPVGIAKLIYFKIYNRFGEMVFSTDVVGKGWNGVFRGRDQGNESFTWQALAIDYLGKPVFRKGQFTIIR